MYITRYLFLENIFWFWFLAATRLAMAIINTTYIYSLNFINRKEWPTVYWCTPHQEFKWYFKITENRRPVKSLRELSFAKFIADNPMVVIPAWLLALFFFSHSSILSHSHLVLLSQLEFYHLSLSLSQPALSRQKLQAEHKYLNWGRNIRDNYINDR